MADYEQADARLMDWLAERTDTQLQRLLDAPEDGLTNCTWVLSPCKKCLAAWAFGWDEDDVSRMMPLTKQHDRGATGILHEYRHRYMDYGTVMRRIQGFAAAELLTRRVERPKLPAPVEVCTADPLNSGYREGA